MITCQFLVNKGNENSDASTHIQDISVLQLIKYIHKKKIGHFPFASFVGCFLGVFCVFLYCIILQLICTYGFESEIQSTVPVIIDAGFYCRVVNVII